MYSLNVAINKNLLTEKPGITEDGKKYSYQQTELGREEETGDAILYVGSGYGYLEVF